MRVFIGIDPGQDGGYAILYEDGGMTYGVMDRDDFVHEMRMVGDEFHHDVYEAIAIVEQVNSMPKQGVASTFKLGKNAGHIEGVLEAFCIPYQLVVPRKWKAEFGLNSDKAKSCEVCKRLFPNVDLRRTERCRKDHDGMAEALLMAEYARRISGRNEG